MCLIWACWRTTKSQLLGASVFGFRVRLLKPAEFISWEVIFVHFAQCLVHLVRHSDLKSCEWSWVLHTETVWNCQGDLTKQRLGKSWLAWLTEPNKGFILTAQGCWGSEHVWTWCPTRLQLRESISTHEAIHQRASEVNWHQCRQHDAVRQEGWNQYYKSMISQICNLRKRLHSQALRTSASVE